MYLAAVPQTNNKEKSILKVTVKTNPRGRFYRSHNFDCQNKSTISTATLNHMKYNQIVANAQVRLFNEMFPQQILLFDDNTNP